MSNGLPAFLRHSPIIDEAKKAKFVPTPFVAVTISLLIMFLGQMVMSFPSAFILLFLFYKNYDFAVLEMEDIFQAVVDITAHPAVMLSMLFGTVFTVIFVFLYAKLIAKKSFASMGFTRRGALKQYLLGLIVGAVMFSLAVLIMTLTGHATVSVNAGGFSVLLVVLFFFGYLIQGAEEEILLRGLLMTELGTRRPLLSAVVMNSVVFAVLHIANNGITPLAFVNLTLFGVFASFYFLKTNSIFGVCAIHSVWNFMQGNFYGLSVSGMAKSESVFTTVLSDSAPILTGGDFGPEGGLAVTTVLTVGVIILFALPSKEHASPMEEVPEESSQDASN